MPSLPGHRNRRGATSRGSPAARTKPGRNGNLPDNAPLRPGPSKRCSRRRARKCLVLTVAAGNAERLGDLGDVEFLDLAQHENRAKRRRELVDRVIDNSPDLAASDRAFGRHGHRAAHQHFAIIVQDRDFTLLEQRSPPLDGTGMSQRIVDDDAGEPGGERGSAREALDRRERLQIGALHRVLGILAIAQYPPRGAKQPLIVAPHDEAHRSGVAARDPGREFEVGAAVVARGWPARSCRSTEPGNRADDRSGVRDDPVRIGKKTPKPPRQRTVTPLIL